MLDVSRGIGMLVYFVALFTRMHTLYPRLCTLIQACLHGSSISSVLTTAMIRKFPNFEWEVWFASVIIFQILRNLEMFCKATSALIKQPMLSATVAKRKKTQDSLCLCNKESGSARLYDTIQARNGLRTDAPCGLPISMGFSMHHQHHPSTIAMRYATSPAKAVATQPPRCFVRRIKLYKYHEPL